MEEELKKTKAELDIYEVACELVLNELEKQEMITQSTKIKKEFLKIDPDKIKYNFKLKIERNKVDEAGTNQILEKIGEKNKYKVSIFYKEQNKLIDYITIEDVSK